MAMNHRPSTGTLGLVESWESKLEQGELIYLPVCPFALPTGADLDLLLDQRMAGRSHKNISYSPATGRAAGFRFQSTERAQRLSRVLAEFSSRATTWLSAELSRYASAWELDRASFRPEEEATRPVRFYARNDLIHIDAFPTRPTRGRCILRCYVNLNPSEPRVWITSEPFSTLLSRFSHEVGLPQGNLVQKLVRLFQRGRTPRSAYDDFMLRFHHYLKRNETFQETCPKRIWKFAPSSAWLAFTDICSHGETRGQFALEHSYFVPPQALCRRELAPIEILQQQCGIAADRLAA